MISTANASSLRASLLLMVVLGYFVLYAPQPLLPYFTQHFSISKSEAGLLMSAIMLPMCLSPLIVGKWFSAFSAVTLLHVSSLVLAVSTVLFSLIDSFPWLLLLRVIQGVFLPQLLTAVMVLLATGLVLDRLVKIMSAYVAATIVGGLCSRLVAGYALEAHRWEWLFIAIAFGFLVVSVIFFRLSIRYFKAPVLSSSNKQSGVFSLPRIAMVFRHPVTRYRLLSIACLFFVFSGMLNYATFRIYEISATAGQLAIGLLYVGYLLGLFVSLSAQSLSQKYGGANRVSMLAYAVFFVAVAMTMTTSEWVLYCALFVFCGAMFLVHSLATAATNALAVDTDDRRLLNASYLTFYYGGGVLGSYIPGLVYQGFGWTAFVIGLLLITVLGWMCLMKSIRSESLMASPVDVFSKL